ncbi:MAG: polysaccharide deacetylase family protein [Bacteriovorax sp.]
MKCVLICHEDETLNQVAMARWLGSFTELVGIVSIREKKTQKHARIKREFKRLGTIRFIDVVLFRIYYHFFLRKKDALAQLELMDKILRQYPAKKEPPNIMITECPNSKETRNFIANLAPDMTIARCKVILKPRIFELPKHGTFVMHPGICPEYRNAHGCFWALMRRDLTRVGMTLLKVNRGVDTGAVFGYFSYAFNELKETHIEIQNRTVFDNLDVIKDALIEISEGTRKTIETQGRGSQTWGQPWMSEYYRWKKRAHSKINNGETSCVLLYHDVDDDVGASGFEGKDADLYKLDVKSFEGHLKAVLECAPIVSCPIDLSSPRPDKTIIFTFDDGGSSAYTNIAPMLEKLGLRGIFFIVTERIGTPGFLTAEQISHLHQKGHVIGSHSHTHPMRFASLGSEHILQEWSKSRKILEKIIGAPVLTASVPGGFYSVKVARLAQQAGYQILYNSEPCAKAHYVEKILVIGRFGVQNQTSDKEVVDLAFDRGLQRLKQAAFWNFKKILKSIGGPFWIVFRKWVLNPA